MVDWWRRKKNPAPLVMTREELEHSADVFSIELLDMQHRHRVLFGDDVMTALQIPLSLHRVQLEYELREKLILLRQRLLETGDNDRALWELLLGSVSAFATLFRHALLALGDAAPHSKREAIQILATKILSSRRPFCSCWTSATTRRNASNSTPRTFSPDIWRQCST